MSRVLITGASSGIGLELAKECARAGHDLVLVSRDMQPINDSLFSGVQVEYLSCDLSLSDSASLLHQMLKNKGVADIDILINNAGFGDFLLFKDADISKLSSMMHLNMVTPTELTKYLLPHMLKQGKGRIMNVASIAAFLPGPYMATYYATKHYILALSEGLAEELRGSGVSVTALCPGPTASSFQKTAAMDVSPLVRGQKLPTAEQVAVYGYGAMMKGRRVAVHGLKNKLTALITRLLPRTVQSRFVARASRPH